jgi:hypothetical protein
VIIHQSDLKSYHRCGEQHRRQRNGEDGLQLSATAYGSVMHHALHVLERERDLDLALNTFTHFWHPLNIHEVCRPVDEWIKRHSYDGLRKQGIECIRRYWDLKQYEDAEELLALEIPLAVNLEGTWDPDTGREHQLLGTIDRLAVRRYYSKPFLCVDDWKSGAQPNYLPFNIQFTAYAYATTKREFWVGNPEYSTEGFGEQRGDALWKRFAKAPRRGYWINIAGTTPKWVNAGERVHRDYLRFLHAVETYAAAVKGGIFPLNIDGSTCAFCPFQSTCPEGLGDL